MYKLVSVSDKTNIEVICSHFIEKGDKILTTGGTYTHLLNRLPEYRDSIVKVSNITDFPEILGGRVKTLHPKIFGGLLCKYDDHDHMKEILQHDIPKINGIIVNLYPFKKTVEKYTSKSFDNDAKNDIIENIDIGGVTLIRAAAKNFKHILTVTSPDDYMDVINYSNDNKLNRDVKQYYATKAFLNILDYDASISDYFNTIYGTLNNLDLKPLMFDPINHRMHTLSLKLKYGCNPYQKDASLLTLSPESKNPFKILNGSCGYINILDAIYSWQLVKELSECLDCCCAASYKHTSPAGVGTDKPLSSQLRKIYDVEDIELSNLATAFIRARNSDPMSSFGDFIALSHEVDVPTAKLIKRYISDGVIAPSYSKEALNILMSKRGGKYLIIEVDPNYENREDYEVRELFGMSLVQNVNKYTMDKNNIGEIVTHKGENLSDEDLRDMIIANVSLKYAQSNNVSYAYDGQLIGLAAGQQNRVDCVRLSGEKSRIWWLRQHPKVVKLYDLFKDTVKRQPKVNAIIRYIQGDFTEIEYNDWKDLFTEIPEELTHEDKLNYLRSLNTTVSLASDAFFPFRDNIDFASKYNVKNIIQPGGSSADETIIDTCNKYNMNMIFTGKRLFYH